MGTVNRKVELVKQKKITVSYERERERKIIKIYAIRNDNGMKFKISMDALDRKIKFRVVATRR